MTPARLVVLDSNVVSELMRPEPSSAVLSWVADQEPGRLSTTALTVAEVHHGVLRLAAGSRRESLLAAATEVFRAFGDRVLAFDGEAALAYASVRVAREQRGRPVSVFDAQIAAICRVRGASLATRNTKDFTDLGLTLVDPWASSDPV